MCDDAERDRSDRDRERLRIGLANDWDRCDDDCDEMGSLRRWV